MSAKRRGLGRGLGALIPTGPEEEEGALGAAAAVATLPTNSQSTEEPMSAADGAVAEVPADDAPSSNTSSASSGAGAALGAGVETRSRSVGRHSTGNWDSAIASGRLSVSGDGSSGETALDTTFFGNGDSNVSRGTDVDLLPVPGARFAELDPADIKPNPRQPRTVFDDGELDELVDSIKEIGVLQPIVVRPDKQEPGKYELIMGERRWRATQAAGLDAIPAIVRDTDDGDMLRDALLENLHRAALNPLEEAAAYRQLLDDFDCTHEELATRIARSRPQISNTLRLLRLPPLVQRRVAAGVLSAGHARALLGLTDGAEIERLAQRIVSEGLSVRATEELVMMSDGSEKVSKARKSPRAGARTEAMDELATRLSDRFETRVKVALGKNKGRMTIEFSDVSDLNRILGVLSPDDPGLLKGNSSD
ncbi:ParB/RepB/Spo0J family partition protein [Myceligenerans pegani]|uniref:ParB/RepB/Spo0J family partition protein n=1 Tax=Myceligenerans pegani TaxID=2776917 RepID=A0ABR9N1K2_9MICO|nr:ParB/RepB/Spo0J family partition protein [Myceligenerans sp. TRM 65318]MBE1877518.1 ParB/RepB/Spo0J family partition protein [Myceligenerans sp. TRM 65318]MBE3019789.1 ParB/RepB/Spo0J family partition protein [Myceligenerans sp. TRM 65318]